MSRHGTVENFQSFDVNVLHRMGALQEPLISYPMVSFRWPGLVRLRANRWRVDVQFRGGAVQTIPLVWSACHFGSHRPWVRCLRCGRRAGKLYNTGVSLHCRRCLDLWYASQRRGSKSRRYLRALRLWLRLNGIATLKEPFRPDPNACTEGHMLVCIVWASGLSKTYGIILVFGIVKPTIRPWFPDDLETYRDVPLTLFAGAAGLAGMWYRLASHYIAAGYSPWHSLRTARNRHDPSAPREALSTWTIRKPGWPATSRR
jgi:hypothetical protein